MPSEDDNAVLLQVADLLAPAAAPVLEAMHQRMADVATVNGATSFWAWVETRVSRALDGMASAAMDGCILAHLLVRPVSGAKAQADDGELLHVLQVLADALDGRDRTYFVPVGDGMYAPERPSVHLVPRLRALAEALELDNIHVAKSSMDADKALIRDLADIYGRAGGRVTSTPKGEFGRLLEAVWRILPDGQRPPTADTFVQYVKTAWDGEATSPLRKRRGQKTQ